MTPTMEERHVTIRAVEHVTGPTDVGQHSLIHCLFQNLSQGWLHFFDLGGGGRVVHSHNYLVQSEV
jgi:hypothetical protein